jgi:hypothetical protein
MEGHCRDSTLVPGPPRADSPDREIITVEQAHANRRGDIMLFRLLPGKNGTPVDSR